MAVQNASQKGKIDFFDKIGIFKGFGEGFGRDLGGVWEGFGRGLGGIGRLLRGLGALWALLVLFAGFRVYFLVLYVFLH